MMLSKRDFMKQAAAVTAAGFIMPAWSSAPFDAVVYNDWHPQAQAFAASLVGQGVRALAIQGDAGRLWYGALRGLVRDGGSVRIVGMTTHTDLLILQTLARDDGLRVRRRSTLSGARLLWWVMT
jgi:hypothetical protein